MEMIRMDLVYDFRSNDICKSRLTAGFIIMYSKINYHFNVKAKEKAKDDREESYKKGINAWTQGGQL